MCGHGKKDVNGGGNVIAGAVQGFGDILEQKTHLPKKAKEKSSSVCQQFGVVFFIGWAANVDQLDHLLVERRGSARTMSCWVPRH
jgi:hypothetical protein